MEHSRITSLQNPRIKSVVRLRKRRERDRLGLMLVEGLRELSRALDAGIIVEEVFICPSGATGKEEKEAIGLKPSGMRLSVGLEDPADIINDLKECLDRI